MILRFFDHGVVVLRDLSGEELYQTIRDRITKDGAPIEPFDVFKGVFGKAGSAVDGLYPWTLSTPDVDRMGDIVDQSWRLDNYKANPVILWAHDHRMPAIGYAASIDVKDNLIAQIRFNPAEIDPFGASIGRRVDFGSIRAGSVGFMPGKVDTIEEERGGKTYITGWKLSNNELHEFSICNVPANPFALSQQEPKVAKAIEPKETPRGGSKYFFVREDRK